MQTIGERLEDARKQRGISIREAAESTKIRGEYLQKFESNHFDVGLSNIYVRGFLRTYANFLKLPAERLLNDYSALGNDEPRARQPSREVYGRMELSVASANERGDRGAPPAEDTAAEAQRAQAKYSRGRSNLPAAPLVDPALVLKIGKIALVVVALVLVLWAGKAIFGGDKSASSTTHTAVGTPTAPVSVPTITLIALDAVQVQVTLVADGKVLLPNTQLVRGQTQVVSKPGAIYITATLLENVAFEENGRRVNLRDQGFKGYNRVQLGAAPGN